MLEAIAFFGSPILGFIYFGWWGILIGFFVGYLLAKAIFDFKNAPPRRKLTEAERVALGGWSNAQCRWFLTIWYAVPALLIFGSWILANAIK